MNDTSWPTEPDRHVTDDRTLTIERVRGKVALTFTSSQGFGEVIRLTDGEVDTVLSELAAWVVADEQRPGES